MNDATREFLKQVDLGLAAKQFLEQTELGRRVVAKAFEDERAAMIALKTVDPANTEKVRALQNEANAPLLALQWFDEIINEGENAKAAALDAEAQHN